MVDRLVSPCAARAQWARTGGRSGSSRRGTMNRKLYVGNLSFSTEEGTLETLFGEVGPVESVRVMRDMATGRARGFAFVEMQTEDGARAAIEKFNNSELDGRRLTVNEARP